MPNALPRSAWLVNVVVSSDSADGTSNAANAPWQARAVISMAKLTEAPPLVPAAAGSRGIRHQNHHFFLCRYCVRTEASVDVVLLFSQRASSMVGLPMWSQAGVRRGESASLDFGD